MPTWIHTSLSSVITTNCSKPPPPLCHALLVLAINATDASGADVAPMLDKMKTNRSGMLPNFASTESLGCPECRKTRWPYCQG